MIRRVAVAVSLAVVVGAGCTHTDSKGPRWDDRKGHLSGPADAGTNAVAGSPGPAVPPPPATGKTNGAPIITPVTMPLGVVSAAKNDKRFAVITFANGQVPAEQTRLSAYRGGLKVADLVVTNKRMDRNVIADIVEGSVLDGDEVRGY